MEAIWLSVHMVLSTGCWNALCNDCARINYGNAAYCRLQLRSKKIDRVKQTLKLGMFAGVVITSSGFFICEFFPHAVSAIFTDSDEDLIDIASTGFASR